MFTDVELKVWKIKKPTEKEIEKAKVIYEKINISNLMTLKGFYIIYGEQIQHLNSSKIKDFNILVFKLKKYKKYIKRNH